MKKIRVISCILTFAVMVLIFFFSSQNSVESSGVSSSVTREIVGFFVGLLRLPVETENGMVDLLHNFVRKTAHFSVFAVLGFSSSLMFSVNTKKRPLTVFAWAVVFSMLYAVSDEIHQLFVSGRAGRVFDVFIDTCGAAFGAAVYRSICIVRKKFSYKFDWWITCTVIVMIAIFLFSSQTSDVSNELSKTVSKLIVDAAEVLFGNNELTAAAINGKVRKVAHFILYFTLGCVSTVMMIKKGGFSAHNSYLIATAVSAAYAACDELHQGFVDGRGPLISDVRLDTCGAVAGSFICASVYILFRKRKRSHGLKLDFKRRYL